MKKYTQDQLHAAFTKVQNKDHWKNPIDVVVSKDEDLDLIREAVIHFAGCVPTFTPARVSWAGVRVRAVGYFVAVGA